MAPELSVDAAGLGPAFEVLAPDGAERPIVVHVPHSSTCVPRDVRLGLEIDDPTLAEELRRLTDHRTDLLAEHVGRHGATRVINRRSRLVVDPERLPDDREEMASIGMGAVYRVTSDLGFLRRPDPDVEQELLARFFHPYAAALTDVVDGLLERHGVCTIVDLHSYPREPLPYEQEPVTPRPELCIGSDPLHTPGWLIDLVGDAARQAGLTSDRDVPFSGTYVPLRWYASDHRVQSVMLELRRDTYLDELTVAPHAGEASVQAFVTDVIRRISRRPPTRSDR